MGLLDVIRIVSCSFCDIFFIIGDLYWSFLSKNPDNHFPAAGDVGALLAEVVRLLLVRPQPEEAVRHVVAFVTLK